MTSLPYNFDISSPFSVHDVLGGRPAPLKKMYTLLHSYDQLRNYHHNNYNVVVAGSVCFFYAASASLV